MHSIGTRFSLVTGVFAVLLSAWVSYRLWLLGGLVSGAIVDLVALVLGLGALLGCILVVYRTTVARRLAEIAKHFRRTLEHGEDDPLVPLPVTGSDEIGLLEESYNALVARFQALRESLQTRVATRASELTKVLAELDRVRQTAESASMAKSRFLAHMSHEIRTPMHAILGMAELTLDSELTPIQREYLKVVEESGKALLSVINDILDFSKIESGRLEVEEVEFQLRETIGDAMKMLAWRAHSKGLELAWRVPADVPEVIIGDPLRLGQVVRNLVGNATKFTDRGEVVLEVIREFAKGDQIVLHFVVRDTGPGIPSDKLGMIFEEFTQVDPATSRHFNGTGLGLAVCTRLVNLLRGRIWAESELGQGSQLHFTAAFRTIPSRRETLPPGAAALAGTRVLVVDDHPASLLILEEMLRGWGTAPSCFTGSPDVLQELHRAKLEDKPYRIVVADEDMPPPGGVALAVRIRQDQLLWETPLVLLSSSAASQPLHTSQDWRLVTQLIKPVKPSELLDAITSLLGHVAAGVEAGPVCPATPATRNFLRILVAEDSLFNQKMVVALLTKHGHCVTVAKNGREAVTAVAAESFDVVLMDIEMPDMDGLEAASLIRVQERVRGGHLPIIAMTAYAMKGDRDRCLEAGMDDYLSKPVRASQLLDKLSEIFEAVRRRCQSSEDVAFYSAVASNSPPAPAG